MMRDRHTLKKLATRIFLAGVEAVDPTNLLERTVKIASDGELSAAGVSGEIVRLDLNRFKRITILSAGKAGATMCAALEPKLFGRSFDGVVVIPDGQHAPGNLCCQVVQASHPIPDARGQLAARGLVARINNLHEDDLVICLLSGGASALLPYPSSGISLSDMMEVTRLLWLAGASILEMNTVRKHLSQIKGGQLVRWAQPATVLSLVISDVVGDAPGTIASGPTVADPTSFQKALNVLKRYHLWKGVPASVRERIRAGCAGWADETPDPGDSIFERAHTLIVGNNRISLNGCMDKATELGFQSNLYSSAIQGNSRKAGQLLADVALRFRERVKAEGPFCLLAGGETTVRVTGAGVGGRNQELALAAALRLAGLDGVAFLSAGTDGIDGPTSAAGAIAFGDTIQRGQEAGLDSKRSLDNNDSHTFFKALDDLIVIGPTGTNVMDIQVALIT